MIFKKMKCKFDILANFGDLTNKTFRRLQEKLNQMLKHVRKCNGGRALGKLLEKWEKTNYKFEMKYASKKRKIEEDLKIEESKNLKLEKENCQLQKENHVLRQQNIRLSKKLIKKSHATLSMPKCRNKEYSRSHERKLRKQRVQNCKDALAFLGLTEHPPVSIQIRSKSGSVETLMLDNEALEQESKLEKQAHEKKLNMLLYAKDRFNISNEAYHELSMILNESMRRSYIVKKRIKEVNDSFNIKPMDGRISGFEQSVKELLPQVILRQFDNENFAIPEVIRVKLSGDGTWLGSKLHVINFTFTLSDFPDAKSSSGNTLLAIFKSSESYENLKIALHNIVNECKDLSYVKVHDKIYHLAFYLGGDLKFLNLVCGIDSNSSTYSCLWCTCPANQRYDITKVWSMTDKTKGARSIEDISKFAGLKRKDNKYNCSHVPIIEFIPLTRDVPDRLHLFLRISDQLINQLIKDLKTEDNITNMTRICDGKRSSYKHIQGFEKFLKEIDSNWNFYVDKESKMLKRRTFSGPDKLKIIKALKVPDLFPLTSQEKTQRIQLLWDSFMALIKDMDELDIGNTGKILDFNQNAKKWVTKYISLYPTKDVTPYMHIMAYHVSETIHMHGSLSQFTQQGLEKLNDHITKWYFRSTGFNQQVALKQLLQKQNRLRKLELDGKRKPNWKCRKCKSLSHSTKKCPLQ